MSTSEGAILRRVLKAGCGEGAFGYVFLRADEDGNGGLTLDGHVSLNAEETTLLVAVFDEVNGGSTREETP